MRANCFVLSVTLWRGATRTDRQLLLLFRGLLFEVLYGRSHLIEVHRRYHTPLNRGQRERTLNTIHLNRLIIGLLMAGASSQILADSYGIFDARGLALGGTGVALGNVDTGHFYNPALTAFHEGHEDRTRDGSHSFHAVLAALSDGARTAADAIADDLEGRLSAAIDNLNQVPTPAAAREGINAALDLNEAMRQLDGKNVNADGYLGYGISLPGDLEGGAFFIGSRFLARGLSDIDSADFDLLQDYVEALEFVESGGAAGEAHPELRDSQGRFIDPSLRIQSSAAGTGLLLSELGVSAAKQYRLWGRDIAFGIAPKVVHLRVFDEDWRVIDGEFASVGEDRTELYFNVDLGMAVTVADHWRVGLATKDLRSKTITTAIGDRIELEPRSRLGLAYISESFDAGLDAELDKTASLQGNARRQDVSLGMEYRFPLLALRLGYRHDLEGSVGDQFSAGMGWRISRLLLDLSYIQGDGGEGAGLRLAWAY